MMRRIIYLPIELVKIMLLTLMNRRRLQISYTAQIPFDFISRLAERDGQIIIGSYFHCRKNCLVRARKKAVVKIGDRVFFNNGVHIISHNSVQIGNDVIIGENVLMYDHNHIFDGKTKTKSLGFRDSPIVIGNNVWIGSNVLILPGVHVGDNSVVGGGTILTKDVPPSCVCYDRRDFYVKKIRNINHEFVESN